MRSPQSSGQRGVRPERSIIAPDAITASYNTCSRRSDHSIRPPTYPADLYVRPFIHSAIPTLLSICRLYQYSREVLKDDQRPWHRVSTIGLDERDGSKEPPVQTRAGRYRAGTAVEHPSSTDSFVGSTGQCNYDIFWVHKAGS